LGAVSATTDAVSADQPAHDATLPAEARAREPEAQNDPSRSGKESLPGDIVDDPGPGESPAGDPPLDEEERPLPDFDGRGEDPTTFGDVAIWVPRVALSPLYLVSEFVIRRPLGWLVTTAEEQKWPAILVDFFTFGPERQAGVIPTGLIDFGFRPSVGLYFFWNDFIADDNHLRLRGAWGGSNWLGLTVADRVDLGDEETVALRGELEHRPDWVFHGIGPRSGQDDEGHFFKRLYDGNLRYERRLPRSSSFRSTIGIRDVSTDSTADGPSVAQLLASGAYPSPPGMDEGYTIAYQSVELGLDTRARRNLEDPREGSDFVSPPGTGIRISARGEHASTLSRAASAPVHPEWIRYSATLGGFVDVTGEQRALGLLFVLDFVDPVTPGAEVPFTEQVRLGGDYVMQGGLEGRLVGRSASVMRFEYQWPAWVWVDGTAFYEVGNVFGEHLDGFSLDLLRSSFGFGVRTVGSRDHPFQTMVAFQTEPFDAGHEVETVRFVFGTNTGF
jgi:hypothetical protein